MLAADAALAEELVIPVAALVLLTLVGAAAVMAVVLDAAAVVLAVAQVALAAAKVVVPLALVVQVVLLVLVVLVLALDNAILGVKVQQILILIIV
jgi:hypothetical protein